VKIFEKLMAQPITNFAAKLRSLKIKNRDLARALGFREETICRWVRGEREPPMGVQLLINFLYENPLVAKRHIDNHLKTLNTAIQAPPRRSKMAVRTDQLGEIVDDIANALDAEDRLDREMDQWLGS
jgi:hypothetical protein